MGSDHDNGLDRPEGPVHWRARARAVVAKIELQSYGKAVQCRAHVMQSIAGERLLKIGDIEGR
jgi:hypothetical protein